MRHSLLLSFLVLSATLAGCVAPEETEASIALREASWGPIPDYYVWDGYEYVGVYDGGYFYLGPGENWMAFDAFRLNRFRLWCAAHPDWRRHAVPNNHHRKGRDGHVHPPREDGRRHHPGDWKDPGPAPRNPPPTDRPGDHRDDRPQGHHPPATVPPPGPPRTGPEGTAANPPQTLNPPKDRPGVQKEKHKHKTKKTPSAPKTGPKQHPPGPPRVTPPPPPAATPPPPPSIKPPAPPAAKPQAPKPSAPPKVDPPRQNDKNADKNSDDKDGGDRRKPR